MIMFTFLVVLVTVALIAGVAVFGASFVVFGDVAACIALIVIIHKCLKKRKEKKEQKD